jgi:IS4 transposase
LHGADKTLDRRCCAYQRRQEAVLKTTEHLETIIRRARQTGIEAAHLVVDSWFTMPATVAKLSGLVNVIGMLKNSPKIHYRFQGLNLDLAGIYRRICKRPGRAKIIGSAMVTVAGQVQAKILFVRNRHAKGWLALLSTDTNLPDEEIIRTYGKRWDIEVFFKMAKQHLKLTKEIQCRDFEALISHTSIVFMRYLFIAWQVRLQTDERTFGDLFYACCDELADLSFIEALQRLLIFAFDRLRTLGAYCQYTAQALIDIVMNAATLKIGLPCGFPMGANSNPES